MFYNSLKILHILSAALFLTGVGAACYIWLLDKNDALVSHRIQNQTIYLIIPFALLQLLTGFTIISLKHYAFSELWIKGSIFCFIISITCWFGFLHFSSSRRVQMGLLSICIICILSMIFFMTNRII